MTPIWMIFLHFTINLHESWVKLNKSCLQGLIITTTCSLSTSNGTVLPPSEKVPCPIKVSRYNCRFQCISMASSGFSPPCHRVIMIVWPPKLDSILKNDHPSIHLGHLKHTFARRIFCYSPMTVPIPPDPPWIQHHNVAAVWLVTSSKQASPRFPVSSRLLFTPMSRRRKQGQQVGTFTSTPHTSPTLWLPGNPNSHFYRTIYLYLTRVCPRLIVPWHHKWNQSRYF